MSDKELLINCLNYARNNGLGIKAIYSEHGIENSIIFSYDEIDALMFSIITGFNEDLSSFNMEFIDFMIC